jgi:hypothetical protein
MYNEVEKGVLQVLRKKHRLTKAEIKRRYCFVCIFRNMTDPIDALLAQGHIEVCSPLPGEREQRYDITPLGHEFITNATVVDYEASHA